VGAIFVSVALGTSGTNVRMALPQAEQFISSRHLRPHPALRRWVSHYWELDGYFDPAQPRSLQRLVPGINTAIIFQLAAPVDVRGPNDEWHRRPTAFAEGHFREPFNLRFAGRFRQVGISFAPGRIHPFLRDSQAQINDRFVDLSDILGGSMRLLTERLQSIDAFEKIAAVFDAFLLPVAPDEDGEEARLNRAVQLAVRLPSATSVDDMASAAGLSARQLERRFQDTVGFSPKYFCRLARFEKFVRRWNVTSGVRLAHLAQACGYFDQSHLNRDFKWFTGETPTSYLTRDRAVPTEICKLHVDATATQDAQ
jgi:AraC-like DNA-binding protein